MYGLQVQDSITTIVQCISFIYLIRGVILWFWLIEFILCVCRKTAQCLMRVHFVWQSRLHQTKISCGIQNKVLASGLPLLSLLRLSLGPTNAAVSRRERVSPSLRYPRRACTSKENRGERLTTPTPPHPGIGRRLAAPPPQSPAHWPASLPATLRHCTVDLPEPFLTSVTLNRCL